ncbi:MAG: hypothetical protein QOJ42_7819 [Acidobacteriaceae bacterium]|nr:hypothetical protein [Acidobacteriaceae bacterium]
MEGRRGCCKNGGHGHRMQGQPHNRSPLTGLGFNIDLFYAKNDLQ